MEWLDRGEYKIPFVMEEVPNARQWVLISHGFGSSKESPTAVSVAKKLREAGIASIRYDFPAHGDSPVDGAWFRPPCCMEDMAAMEALGRQRMPDAEIGYFSSSFGAFINLCYLASGAGRGKKSFLRCAAVDMPGIVEGWMDEQTRQDMERDGYVMAEEDYVRPLKITRRFVEELKQIDLFRDFRLPKTHIRMIHGTGDETAPYADAMRFSRRFGLELISVEGADHQFTGIGEMDRVREEAIRFFAFG